MNFLLKKDGMRKGALDSLLILKFLYGVQNFFMESQNPFKYCLFCDKPESNYDPGPNIDFICGSCVLLLSSTDQDLKQALIKAEANGLKNKALALKSFIIEDEFNVRKTKKLKRDMARKRPLRTVRPSRDQVRAKQTVV
jgi:hypothetical protein